jgi:hypothetical protein
LASSALNIVGEKDMECAVCKAGVENFHLKSASECSSPITPARPKFSGVETANVLLPSAFDINPFLVQEPQFFGRIQGTSTPIAFDSQSLPRVKEAIVLRIDNVPWVRRSSNCQP